MQRKLLATAIFALFASSSYAQTPVLNPVTPITGTAGPNGSAQPVSPSNPLPVIGSGSGGSVIAAPYQYSPTTATGSDQHNVALTSATALSVPADAICANISTKGGAVNWRWDGTAPTGTVGNGQAAVTMAFVCGRNILNALQFIQQTGNTSTLDVAYSK